VTTVTFYTVGHSTRTFEQLLALLRVGSVAHVVDVRAMPRSRTNPQFNHGVLTDALPAQGIDYTHSPALTGLRKRSKSLDDALNGYWRNRSFHNYADYALSDEFRNALRWLIELGQGQTCAIMCAEAVWWRCHRRIIADHLLHRGERVCHLMNDDRIHTAVMTSGARSDASGTLVYPADAG
jgi:uncharacterized protein (DUF488 family)